MPIRSLSDLLTFLVWLFHFLCGFTESDERPLTYIAGLLHKCKRDEKKGTLA